MSKNNPKWKKSEWKKIADENVQHIWTCDSVDCPKYHEPVSVFPTFYAEAGEPVCGNCGQDMSYCHTEIKT